MHFFFRQTANCRRQHLKPKEKTRPLRGEAGPLERKTPPRKEKVRPRTWELVWAATRHPPCRVAGSKWPRHRGGVAGCGGPAHAPASSPRQVTPPVNSLGFLNFFHTCTRPVHTYTAGEGIRFYSLTLIISHHPFHHKV